MKIATWNVNSVRMRLDILTRWLEQNPVDIVCLQETKVVDELFPIDDLERFGYHVWMSGQKSYNGVAILSNKPLTDISVGFGGVLSSDIVGDLDEQKRVISGVFEGIRIVNVYVPNGNSVGSEKYEYKLRWLELLRQYLMALLERGEKSICICGDFNIALEDRDIYAEKGDNHIMNSAVERAALRRSILDLGLRDSFRKFNLAGGYYSWWDYRQTGFEQNRGWRIDHIYLTPDLLDRSRDCRIDIEPRKLTQPSDHTPAIVEIDRVGIVG
jgi:exodeoxyribonuclease III